MVVTFNTFVPLYLVILPMLTGILLYLFPKNRLLIHKIGAMIVSLFSMIGVIWLLPYVLQGEIVCGLTKFMELGLYFSIDLISWIFAGLITLVYFLVVLFSFSYMDQDHNPRRYYSFLFFTLGAILGVVFAGDFFSFFIFFEILTLSSFVLVIHKQDRDSLQAGSLYLYMNIIGGLALLFAILLLYDKSGHLDMIPVLEELGAQRLPILFLFMICFGIKIGLVPFHIWAPPAYSAAPSPVTVVMAGIMSKVGIYGILRVSLILLRPANGGSASDWIFIFNSGYILMWIGIVTMIGGALMALLQSNTMRILAYSSISQVGYIAAGLGVAVFMGLEGAKGFTGALYHVANHTVFKAGLFSMIGVVYLLTHEQDLSRLGGMARKMPLVTVTFVITALGIAGMPGFNGFASKILLHNAMVEAYEHYGIYGIFVAERFFIIAGALTVCYLIKLFRGVFWGPVPGKLDQDYKMPVSASIALVVYAIMVMGGGVLPNLLLERLLIPGAQLLDFSAYNIEHLPGFGFYEWFPLQKALVVVLLALFIYMPASARGWFDWAPPSWLSIQKLIIEPIWNLVLKFLFRGINVNDMALGQFYEHPVKEKLQTEYLSDQEVFQDSVDDETGQSAYYISGKGLDRGRHLEKDFYCSFRWDQRKWRMENLSFDTLLFAFVLAVLLFIAFLYIN